MIRFGRPLSRIEAVLYGERSIFDWEHVEREAFFFDAIRDAFSHHYLNCLPFHRYCDSLGVTPAAIVSHDDISLIPLITSSVFKSMEVRSVPEEQIAKVCLSSGTHGRLSRVFRDASTLERFVGSIRVSAEQILGLHADAEVFNLGPDVEEAGDIWFSYVTSLLGLLRPSRNYVVNSVFYPATLTEDLLALPPTTQPFLVGPPALFLHLLNFLEAEGVKLTLGGPDAFVITAGGWKGFNKEIERLAFVQMCVQLLGLHRTAQVRDAYNMVELNTVIVDCEAGNKHIPPWLCVKSLDPGTLRPREPDKIGLIAFYDPLPTSYPGFVLSDDFGSVSSERCACGRAGPTMRFSRRVALVEARGCALSIDQRTRTSGESVRISRARFVGGRT